MLLAHGEVREQCREQQCFPPSSNKTQRPCSRRSVRKEKNTPVCPFSLPAPPRFNCSPYFSVYSAHDCSILMLCVYVSKFMNDFISHIYIPPISVLFSSNICNLSMFIHLVLVHEREVFVVPLYVCATMYQSILLLKDRLHICIHIFYKHMYISIYTHIVYIYVCLHIYIYIHTIHNKYYVYTII